MLSVRNCGSSDPAYDDDPKKTLEYQRDAYTVVVVLLLAFVLIVWMAGNSVAQSMSSWILN